MDIRNAKLNEIEKLHEHNGTANNFKWRKWSKKNKIRFDLKTCHLRFLHVFRQDYTIFFQNPVNQTEQQQKRKKISQSSRVISANAKNKINKFTEDETTDSQYIRNEFCINECNHTDYISLIHILNMPQNKKKRKRIVSLNILYRHFRYCNLNQRWVQSHETFQI